MLLTLVLLMHTKLLYHWTLTNPLVLIILGEEYCIAVLKHFVNLFITYSLYHYAMQLYLHAEKFTRWFLHIFKAGDPNYVTNYQRISLLSNASKVLERLLIFDKLIGHVTKSISPLQFGFTKNCSTLQQMFIFLDEITNTPAQTDVIYFDISIKLLTLCHIAHYLGNCGILALLALFGPGLKII